MPTTCYHIEQQGHTNSQNALIYKDLRQRLIDCVAPVTKFMDNPLEYCFIHITTKTKIFLTLAEDRLSENLTCIIRVLSSSLMSRPIPIHRPIISWLTGCLDPLRNNPVMLPQIHAINLPPSLLQGVCGHTRLSKHWKKRKCADLSDMTIGR